MTPPEPSLHVFVSGFGSPHLQEKLRILNKNMGIINRYGWSRVQYTVCCYDNSDLSALEKNPGVEVVRDRLIVGQFLKKYLVPYTGSTDFTYLLCMLDDIELHDDMDFGCLIQYNRLFHTNILSPSMTHNSKYQFQYMLQDTSVRVPYVKITSALEYFCYFMTPASYAEYYIHINAERNPWMWGLDMLLYKHCGLTLGVVNHMTMTHWFKNESYVQRPDANPCDGYNYVLERYNETTDSLANQPSIMYIIQHVGVPAETRTTKSDALK